MDDGIRLSRLMAQQGLCSRREADRLISAGEVLVDGTMRSLFWFASPDLCGDGFAGADVGRLELGGDGG